MSGIVWLQEQILQRSKLKKLIARHVHTRTNAAFTQWDDVACHVANAERADLHKQELVWANQARRDRLVEKISRQLTEFTGSVFSAWTRHVEEEQRTRAQKVAKRESMLRQMVAQSRDVQRRIFMVWFGVLHHKKALQTNRRQKLARFIAKMPQSTQRRILLRWSTFCNARLHEKKHIYRILNQLSRRYVASGFRRWITFVHIQRYMLRILNHLSRGYEAFGFRRWIAFVRIQRHVLRSLNNLLRAYVASGLRRWITFVQIQHEEARKKLAMSRFEAKVLKMCQFRILLRWRLFVSLKNKEKVCMNRIIKAMMRSYLARGLRVSRELNRWS